MERSYFIKLKPLNTFYFGSVKGFDEKNTEYFLKSGMYPQQTAVLGMLRKKILEDNGCLVPEKLRTQEHRKKEKEYIGEVKTNIEDSNFGKIHSLSSIQIYKKDTPYIFSYFGVDFLGNSFLTNKGDKDLANYDAKNFQGKPRKSKDDTEEVLKETVEIGIKKLSKSDASLFKKQRYCFLDRDFYFGFYTTLSEEIKLKNGIVQIGDKYSIFYLEVKESEIKEKEVSICNIKNSIFFMSDAYLYQEDLEEILKESKGMLLQNNKFKFISREENKYKIQQKIKNLLGRGSILFLGENNNEKILKILQDKKYENYKKIGLNDYKIIGGNI